MSGFRVTWPQAAIHIDGRDVVLRRGDTVPDGYDEQNIALLVTVGAVAPVTAAAEAAVVEDAPVSTVLPTKAPAKSADKAAWVDWAVANGATTEEAEAAKKADLIASYADATPVPSSLPDGDPTPSVGDTTVVGDPSTGADDQASSDGTEPSLPG